jgi:hypothetical protein
VPVRKACTPDGLACAYPEGQCNCADTLPISNSGPVWQCTTPTGCPEPRPRIGSECTQDGLQCDYNACIGGVAFQCTNGIWRQAEVGCPL